MAAALESLTETQRIALGRLQSITHGTDLDAEIRALHNAEWDVQRAADAIFESLTLPETTALEHPRNMEGLEIDDSSQSGLPSHHSISLITPSLQIITYPFTLSYNILSSLLTFVFRILRIPFPAFSSIWRPDPRRGLAHDPASVADRWVRQLEEETGAIRGSRIDSAGITTGAEAGPGPNTLSRRSDLLNDDSKRLPEFYLGGYEEVLRIAQKKAQVLCVVLVSDEHDDVAQFKRYTLTDPAFNEILKTNNFLVWGGDVRDRDAHQASQKLSVTTYPFVAFIALQPRHGPRSSSTSDPSAQEATLTVLSRHQGPSISTPLSSVGPMFGPTSAQSLCNHLTNQLLPRVSPFLGRIRTIRQERERERMLRSEQDSAFALSAQRDRERIEAQMAAEQARLLEMEHAERQRREEEADRLKELEELEAATVRRMDWCRYARRVLLPPEPAPGQATIRIGIRLSDGRRLIRRFSPADTLTSLYTFVAIQSIPAELTPSDDPASPPEGYLPGESGVKADWPFKLATAYPRSGIPWKAGMSIHDVNELKEGGQVVVEENPISIGRVSKVNSGDPDGYNTEEE